MPLPAATVPHNASVPLEFKNCPLVPNVKAAQEGFVPAGEITACPVIRSPREGGLLGMVSRWVVDNRLCAPVPPPPAQTAPATNGSHSRMSDMVTVLCNPLITK